MFRIAFQEIPSFHLIIMQNTLYCKKKKNYWFSSANYEFYSLCDIAFYHHKAGESIARGDRFVRDDDMKFSFINKRFNLQPYNQEPDTHL